MLWARPPIVSLHGAGHGAFPMPYLLAFMGYALILLIDKVLFDPHKYLHGHVETATSINERDSDYRKTEHS